MRSQPADGSPGGPADDQPAGVSPTTVRSGDARTQIRARPDPGTSFLSRHPLVCWGAVYAVLSFVVWWGVWTTGPSSHNICPCGDAARFLWFFEWPAYSMAHGLGLLHSTRVFTPRGLNLLSDTSVLALGVVLAPVTLWLGPVVSMNVASSLAPFLSALAMLWLLRRWVGWGPAAALGGLLYGFAPFVLIELGYGQLNMSFLALPPLFVAVLHELLIVRRRSPVWLGLALALLVAVQFFISIELLLMIILVALVAMVVIGARWVTARSEVRARLAYVGTGLGVAVVAAAVLLAYPLWYFLKGPAHLSGPIWANASVSSYGNSLTSFWDSSHWKGDAFVAEMLRLGGYQGAGFPILGYLGIGVVVVAVAGAFIWHRDRVLVAFVALGLLTAALSLGPSNSYWVPWDALRHLPWLGDIAEIRFSSLTALSAAAAVALSVDHARAAATAHAPGRARHGGRRSTPAVLGSLAALAVAAVAVVPALVTLWPNLPLTTQPVRQPRWYEAVGERVPSTTVVLAYPAPFSGIQSSLAWQAVDRLHYAMAGGGGPAGVAARAGSAEPGFNVLLAASLPIGGAPEPSSANNVSVRHALALWRVTTVVVPDQTDLPAYDYGRSVPYAVGFFAAVLGQAPRLDHDAWVWGDVRHAGAAVSVTAARFAQCTTGSTASLGGAAVAHCVLAPTSPR